MSGELAFQIRLFQQQIQRQICVTSSTMPLQISVGVVKILHVHQQLFSLVFSLPNHLLHDPQQIQDNYEDEASRFLELQTK